MSRGILLFTFLKQKLCVLMLIKCCLLNLCPCMGIRMFGGSFGISDVFVALAHCLTELGPPILAEWALGNICPLRSNKVNKKELINPVCWTLLYNILCLQDIFRIVSNLTTDKDDFQGTEETAVDTYIHILCYARINHPNNVLLLLNRCQGVVYVWLLWLILPDTSLRVGCTDRIKR